MNVKLQRAFTLIESLVSIAVIVLLAAIIVPVVTKVRENSQRVTGLSNLRQLGTAVQLFTSDFGFYPPGAARDLDENRAGQGAWYDIISPYLGARGDNTSYTGGGTKKPVLPVFDSPAKAIPTDEPMVAFIANRHVMPDRMYGNPDTRPSPIRPTEVFRPSHLILLMDGVQNPTTGVVRPYTLSMTALQGSGPKSERYFSPFPNVDDGSYYPRFRHWSSEGSQDGSMQVLFADGHVDYIENGKLKLKNIIVGE